MSKIKYYGKPKKEPDIDISYYELLNKIADKYGKPGLWRLIRIFDIIEEVEIKRTDK